jgi:hypothetical protein
MMAFSETKAPIIKRTIEGDVNENILVSKCIMKINKKNRFQKKFPLLSYNCTKMHSLSLIKLRLNNLQDTLPHGPSKELITILI